MVFIRLSYKLYKSTGEKTLENFSCSSKKIVCKKLKLAIVFAEKFFGFPKFI